MKFTLLMEDATGRKDAMRVIADSLPDALFAFVVEAVQTDAVHTNEECSDGACGEPIEVFNPEDTEMFLAWKNNGGRNEQGIIREVT